MADTKTNEAKISIKVTVDKVKKRVVYVVADHTFVDILFSFMTLPMGTIVRLLGKLDDKKFEVLGSLNNLYQSLKDFPECYFDTKEYKSKLLNPRSLSFDHYRNLKQNIDDTELVRYIVYNNSMCPVSGIGYEVDDFGEGCSCCWCHCSCCWCHEPRSLDYVYRYSLPCVGDSVFVSDFATFIITDDVCVEPYTSASSVRLLTDFGITDINHLEERNLDMSSHQVLQFLEMSLSTDCPFTYFVFSKIHNSVRESVGSGQCIIPDEFDLVKKEVSTSSKMVLGVSMQRSTGKLLFAEAKEDFIEFLFGVLSIPLGTVVGTLMNGASSFSCMDNIFKSISNMSVRGYLKSQDIKEMLLKPHIGQKYSLKHHIFTLSDNGSSSVIYGPEDLLKQCGMFVVTDDLTVTPSSSFSTINILKKCKVFPDDIERYEVSIGLKRA